jgi:protein-tyrosine phosphatase
MRPSIYKIDSKTTGVLFVMPKPSGDWLDDDLKAYKEIGVDKIVSLLTREEVDELGLQNEKACCEAFGMGFYQLSIVDRGLPDTGRFTDLVANVSGHLIDGQSISIHCRAGIGRAGMLASCCLVHLGMTAEQAISTVCAGRGVVIPDTEEQKEFIFGYGAMQAAFRQE